MYVEHKRIYQWSNKCWICNKLFSAGDNNARDHDHVTEQYRGSAN